MAQAGMAIHFLTTLAALVYLILKIINVERKLTRHINGDED